MGNLFILADFVENFVPRFEIGEADDIIFKLLKMCNREIQSTDISTVVKQMNNAYQFVYDFGWYFYGKLLDNSETYWQMDLKIKMPGLFRTSQQQINFYLQDYYEKLYCKFVTPFKKPDFYERPTGLVKEYYDAFEEYLNDWAIRINSFKNAFLAYIDQI